jgi:hypothetical protein
VRLSLFFTPEQYNSSQGGNVMIHHVIDRAISLVELHQNYIDLYEDILEWNEEDNLKVEYSDDGTEYNQNIIAHDGMDEEFIRYCRKELTYHNHEMERAQQRLRICMWTFNRGWTFE